MPQLAANTIAAAVVEKPQQALLSVIIPTYNRSALLPDAVRSVLTQDYPNLEVIIVDDGSTDDTPNVIASLSDWDVRVRTFRQANARQAACVNRGLDLAQGQVACMLSDDDMLYPGALSRGMAALAANPEAVVAFGDLDMIDFDGNHLRIHRAAPITLESILAHHEHNIGVGALFRTDAARRAGGWNPHYYHVPDFDFWLRIGLQGSFEYVPELFGYSRVHENQITSKGFQPECAAEHVEVIEEFLRREDLPNSLLKVAAQARSSAHFTAAILSDPDFCHSSRRFQVLDRFSIARGEQSGKYSEDDAIAKLNLIAAERLSLIEELDRTAKEQARIIGEFRSRQGFAVIDRANHDLHRFARAFKRRTIDLVRRR